MVEINNEEFNVDEINIAVIFRKSFSQRLQRIIYEPFKVLMGNMEYQEYMFIDEDGNSYHHIYEQLPGNSYAFRKTLKELEIEYDTTNYEIIKEKYFEEINNYFYHLVKTTDESNSEYTKIIMENKETHEQKELEDDDSIEFMDPLDLSEEQQDITFKESDEETPSVKEIKDSKINLPTFNTHQLVSKIKESVLSQDDAIERIVTVLWTNLADFDIHNNILLIGNTGVGKTEIMRVISKELDIPFVITSMASHTASGYIGKSVTSVLDDLVRLSNGDIKKAEHGIIFLDEIDKIAARDNNINSGIKDEDLQNELLKIMEDGTFTLKIDDIYSSHNDTINTKNITFIGAGTFEGILKTVEEKHIGFGNRNNEQLKKYQEVQNEHLIKYGFKPEFVGRFQSKVVLNDLKKEDLIKIIKNPNGILQKFINMFNDLGIIVKIDEEVYDLIAEDAIVKKIGARGLQTTVNNLFSSVIYEISSNNKYNYLEITKDTINDPNNYILKNKSKRGRTLKRKHK